MTFITREQYDRLVERYPAFMAIDWFRFKKTWVLGGVNVERHEHAGWQYALEANLRGIGK